MSPAVAARRATLDDLMRHDGKAELINGVLVPQLASGHRPNVVAGRVFYKLAEYVDERGVGFAYTDNMGFAVENMSSGRESFSPDVAYYGGPPPVRPMKFVHAAPDFAVEVRSDGDTGPAAEAEIAGKRADYFEAGTKVVWDVDPQAGTVVRHQPGEPPVTFAAGSEADAEPALPGWCVAVDWLMA